MILALILSSCATIRLVAQANKQYQTATLVEAEEYEPCDWNCGAFNHPTTAYCFRVANLSIVGERGGFLWLGETNRAAMRDFAGREVQIRFDQTSIWINRADQQALKLKHGSIFEGFKDMDCVAEVHKAKLALASKSGRPSNIPSDAFALAGPLSGNARPLFRWFQCAMSADSATITCKKWGRDGGYHGVDRYCARTVAGEPVLANFEVDQLLSRDGKLILKSGSALERDERGRTNDELTRPGEACHQTGLNR